MLNRVFELATLSLVLPWEKELFFVRTIPVSLFSNFFRAMPQLGHGPGLSDSRVSFRDIVLAVGTLPRILIRG